MMQQNLRRKIFTLIAMAPCLAAVSLLAQEMGGPGGLGAVDADADAKQPTCCAHSDE